MFSKLLGTCNLNAMILKLEIVLCVFNRVGRLDKKELVDCNEGSEACSTRLSVVSHELSSFTYTLCG